MPNYLLVEDNETQWKTYNKVWLQPWIAAKIEERGINDHSREEQMFSSLEAHPKNHYLPNLEAIKDNISAALLDGNLDLLISDIALGGEENYMEDTAWIDKVLMQIIQESPKIQAILNRRNMGLVIMTRHSSDIVANFIQRAQVFLNTWFPGWVFLTKNNFIEGFQGKFNELATSYQVVRGRWCHLAKVTDYINHLNGGMVHQFEWRKDVNIMRQQIIAIEATATTATIVYADNPMNPTQVLRFVADGYDVKAIKAEFADAFTLLNNGLPEGFDPEEAYFLHIRENNPFTLINQNFIWNATSANHGRILTLDNARDQNGNPIQVHCRFECLNSHFPIEKSKD